MRVTELLNGIKDVLYLQQDQCLYSVACAIILL